MKEKFQRIIESIFSIFLMIALLGGGIIFIMLIISIILGGQSGESLAIKASKEVMPYFIRAASIAVLSGLVSFYTTGKHTLSLDERD